MGTSRQKGKADPRSGRVPAGLNQRKKQSQEQKDYDRIARIILISTKLIAAYYNSPRGTSVREMQALCGVSDKTIYRDIIAISRTGTEVMSGANGARWIKPGDFIPPMQFSDSEAVMLFLASRLLAQNSNDYNPTIISAFEKLNAAFRNPVSLQIAKSHEWLSRQPRHEGRVRILNELAAAWIKGRRVRIRYQKLAGTAADERDVDIYFIQPALLEHANYVIGFCHKTKRVSVFKIERIKGVSQLFDQPYDIPEDFNVNDFLGHAWGVSIYGPLEDVVIRFSGKLATVAAETRWHPSQENRTEKDGSVTVKFKMQLSPPFIGFLLGWGPAVEVISPPSLREEVASQARAVCEIYKGVSKAGTASRKK
jgi:predicted DNA-binding transcriptional regulator YafY